MSHTQTNSGLSTETKENQRRHRQNTEIQPRVSIQTWNSSPTSAPSHSFLMLITTKCWMWHLLMTFSETDFTSTWRLKGVNSNVKYYVGARKKPQEEMRERLITHQSKHHQAERRGPLLFDVNERTKTKEWWVNLSSLWPNTHFFFFRINQWSMKSLFPDNTKTINRWPRFYFVSHLQMIWPFGW